MQMSLLNRTTNVKIGSPSFVIQKISNKKYYKGDQDTEPNDLLKISKTDKSKFTDKLKEALHYKNWDDAYNFIKERKTIKYEILEV